MQSFSNILEIICVRNQRYRSIILSARSNGAIRDVVHNDVTSKFKIKRIHKLKQSGIFQHFQLLFNPLSGK